jgi:hypothetical protein
VTTTQLALYNEALRLCGERKLTSTSENREPRRVLDSVWDAEFRNYVLEQGLWNFATRTVQIDYSPSVDPEFGYTYAFDKPTDWIRTVAISEDEYFTDPLLRYNDDTAYWFADAESIYVRYISNNSSYGLDYAKWPASFTRYVATHLAAEASPRLTHNENTTARLEKKAAHRLTDAQAKDALNQPTVFPPRGSWLRARTSGSNSRYDRA